MVTYREENPQMPATITPVLPDHEQLDATWSDLFEMFGEISALADQVFAVINNPDEQTVTLEQIGALTLHVRDLRAWSRDLADLADKLERATLIDLDEIRREGKSVSVPSFDRYGLPNRPKPRLSLPQEEPCPH